MQAPLTPEQAARLDGTPEEFPHREAAMAEYRALWLGFLMGESEPAIGDMKCPTENVRRRMDELQLMIARGPGPVWKAFAASLPGYLEWWGNFDKTAKTLMSSRSPS